MILLILKICLQWYQNCYRIYKKANHNALFIFAACNGSARMELVNFTFGQFLECVKPFCNNLETSGDIINDFNERLMN